MNVVDIPVSAKITANIKKPLAKNIITVAIKNTPIPAIIELFRLNLSAKIPVGTSNRKINKARIDSSIST